MEDGLRIFVGLFVDSDYIMVVMFWWLYSNFVDENGMVFFEIIWVVLDCFGVYVIDELEMILLKLFGCLMV